VVYCFGGFGSGSNRVGFNWLAGLVGLRADGGHRRGVVLVDIKEKLHANCGYVDIKVTIEQLYCRNGKYSKICIRFLGTQIHQAWARIPKKYLKGAKVLRSMGNWRNLHLARES
jgi:hypothetical protein